MRGFLTDHSGRVFAMPTMLSWCMCHTLGEPSDSFEVCCLYDGSMIGPLSDAVRFRAEHGGETVFRGVVDEFEVSMGERDSTVSISGRGLAALLLDNEAEAAEYGACTLAEVLSKHVRPFGITDIETDPFPSAASYSVENGASQWSVLRTFTDRVGGIVPRFSKDGTLIISSADGSWRRLDASAAYDVTYREKRYGVISEVLVKNTLAGTSETVKNADFIARGGCARRVVTVPRKTGENAMRYNGSYKIAASEAGSRLLRLTVPQLFAAFPNDLVELDLPAVGARGVYRVSGSECWADAASSGTRLELVKC